MRFSSCSESPSSTAARRRVTYLSSCVFMSVPSRWQKNHAVFFHGQDHGLVNVHVPAFANPHAHGVASVFQQLSSQRHLNIAQCHLKNDRLPNPSLERAIHSLDPSELQRDEERIAQRIAAHNGTERVRD